MEDRAKRQGDNQYIIQRFNERDRNSFGEIYSMIYPELCFVGKRLTNYEETETEDLIQDIFLKIWDDRTIKFETIHTLKSYIYKSISNSYKNLYNHRKRGEEIINDMAHSNISWQTLAIESEVIHLTSIVLKMVPEFCAESFKLFLEGYSNKEVAHILNKPTTTINSQKQKALNILKEKLSNHQLSIIMNLLGC